MNAFTEDLRAKIGDEPMRRFIPYVQMHEFEGLLFSDASSLADGINRRDLDEAFRAIRDNFNSPEDINDRPDSAPSKRIKQLYGGYEKPLHGSLAAIEIGIDTIRRECPLFDGWLIRIEALG